MATFKGLPVFELTFSEDFIPSMQLALVDLPAIAANFLKFKEERRKAYLVSNEEQHIIFGPAMIPELPIYRIDESGEYYIKFSAETIAQIASAFAKGHNFNLNHDMARPAQCTLLESYLINTDEGKYPPADFGELPNGTWMVKAHIDDETQWEDVKAGLYNGFSIESFFNYHKLSSQMNILEQLAKAVIPEEAKQEKCAKVVAKNEKDESVVLNFDGEVMEDGTIVTVIGEDGAPAPAPDGVYTIQGSNYVVAGGVITKEAEEVAEPEVKEPVENAAEEEVIVETPVEEEPKGPSMEERIDKMEAAIAEIFDRLDAINAALAPMAEMHEEMKTLRSKQKELDKLTSKLKEVHGEPVESTTLRAAEQKKDENPALKFFRR